MINKISLDASSICQLKCPECSTSKGIIKDGIVGSGFLSFENFKGLIDKNPTINKIELSNWGEIFLNPDLLQIIRFAYERNIKLSAGNGVNFNTIDDNVLEALVKYQFGYLNVSIDGASQETYSIYRIKGNYDKVIENIRKLNVYKNKYKSSFPKLSWQFIIFGHNEHEIGKVKSICHELNMVFIPRLNNSNFSPVIDKVYVREQSGLGVASRDEYRLKFKKIYKRPCCQFWDSPQINWDGKLLGCCVNKWSSFGNVFTGSLLNCLRSNLYINTKLTIKGIVGLTEEMPCFKCPTYQTIREQPITDDEINNYIGFIHPAERQ